MKQYEIWMEGYLCSGMDGIPANAMLLGTVEAESFKEACATLCSPKGFQKHYGNFDSERLSVWGCRLFDNEADARRSFG